MVKSGLQVLSNMPEKSRTRLAADDLYQVEFLESPKMSTYLLAFVVGEFDYVSAVTPSGTLIRCLSVPGKAHELPFALDVAVRCLEYYNEFFKIGRGR